MENAYVSPAAPKAWLRWGQAVPPYAIDMDGAQLSGLRGVLIDRVGAYPAPPVAFIM